MRLIATEHSPSYKLAVHRCIAARADPRALLDLMTRSGLDADDATEKMKKDIFYRFDPRVLRSLRLLPHVGRLARLMGCMSSGPRTRRWRLNCSARTA